MTKEKIIEGIEINSGFKGDEARNKAENGYNSALVSLGRIDIVPWNKLNTTITLTAGTDKYVLGSDILSDFNDIKGLTQIWRTDEKDWRVDLLKSDQFNTYKRGDNTPGAPYCATITKNADGEKELEFFYNPDDAYVLWVEIRTSLSIDKIDDDYLDIVKWKGVMHIADPSSGFYRKAKEEFSDIMSQLRAESYQKWDGTYISPAYRFGSQGGARGTDSGRLFNFGR